MTIAFGAVPPAVSIVIPTRNRRRLLPAAIDSVLAQRDTTFEVIVVDDGSTDDTPVYLAAIAAPPIRTLRLEPAGGGSRARNVGLDDVRAPFVMFLDDDDILWPGALATLSGALRAEPSAVAAVGARWDWFTEEQYERRDAHPRRARTRVVFDELLFGWSAPSGQVLYRADIVRQVGGYRSDFTTCEDRGLWLRIARHGPVVLRPEIVMTYRWHPGQTPRHDIRTVRERVALRAIDELPRRDHRRALAIRRSTHWFEAAQDAFSAGRYIYGATAAARAVAASPALFASPLVWPLFTRRLAGRIWHRRRGR